MFKLAARVSKFTLYLANEANSIWANRGAQMLFKLNQVMLESWLAVYGVVRSFAGCTARYFHLSGTLDLKGSSCAEQVSSFKFKWLVVSLFIPHCFFFKSLRWGHAFYFVPHVRSILYYRKINIMKQIWLNSHLHLEESHQSTLPPWARVLKAKRRPRTLHIYFWIKSK